LNPGVSKNTAFCFEVPKENLSFILHIYQYDIERCKDPSLGDCQEKTTPFTVKSPSLAYPLTSESEIEAPQLESQEDIVITQGSSIPGCEKDRSCYFPYMFDAGKGSVISWENLDSVAHTVTSGTPSRGPTSTFDSEVILPGTTYSNKFEKDDVINYFCTLHPWMTGVLNITRSGVVIGNSNEESGAENISTHIPPPKLFEVVDIVLNSEDQKGTKVTFDVLAKDSNDQIIIPSCNPRSGSLFPIGQTIVICNAMDSVGNRATPISFTVTINLNEIIIPSWVKNNAGWWASDNISESEFLNAIEYLIENKIIKIPTTENEHLPSIRSTYTIPDSRSTKYVEIIGSFTEKHEGTLTLTVVKPDKSKETITTFSRNGNFMTTMALTNQSLIGNYQVFAEIKGNQILVFAFDVKGNDFNKVPTWIKNNADWWANEKITDGDFIKGIQYLLEQGIIKV
jgi:plastocyanin